MGSIASIIHPFPHPKIFLWGSLVHRVVIKSRGPGIFPGYYECGPGYFYWKIEEK